MDCFPLNTLMDFTGATVGKRGIIHVARSVPQIKLIFSSSRTERGGKRDNFPLALNGPHRVAVISFKVTWKNGILVLINCLLIQKEMANPCYFALYYALSPSLFQYLVSCICR